MTSNNPTKREKYRIMFFSNGNSAVFDSTGEQVTHLQEPWFLKYMEYLFKQDVSLEDIEEILLPTGNKAKIFKTENGYNWEII